jgi:hypothetical protein
MELRCLNKVTGCNGLELTWTLQKAAVFTVYITIGTGLAQSSYCPGLRTKQSGVEIAILEGQMSILVKVRIICEAHTFTYSVGNRRSFTSCETT